MIKHYMGRKMAFDKRGMAAFFAIALMGLSGPASAALAPLSERMHYDFSWMGMGFGAMDLNAHESAGRYEATMTIRSTGLAQLFSPLSGKIEVNAGPGGRLYEAFTTSGSKKNHYKLAWDGAGNLTERIVEPAEDPGHRPDVPPELARGVNDPLSFLLNLRQDLSAARDKGEAHFATRIFDTKRVTEAVFTIEGRETIEWQGEKVPVIHCIGRRVPLAGFTEKEKKRVAKGEPPLHVFFSDDEKLLPIRMHFDAFLGRVKAEMAR